MKRLAILIGKIIGGLGSLMGRGSALPGKVALSIDPDLMSKIDMPRTIMVTGTNGKTSTAHFTAQILGQNNKVIHNAQGANMPQGIASLILKSSDLAGRVQADYAVLEVDEAFLSQISQAIQADYFVFTNISQDQIDRFTSLKMVEDLLYQGVTPGARLIANANDPSLVNLASSLDNETIYYGVDLKEGQASFACPSCGKDLNYTKEYYGNIGVFSCSCGLKTPQLDYLIGDLDLDAGSFSLDGQAYQVPYHADYIFYNLAAALALAREEGIEPGTIRQALEDFQIGGGRMETVTFAGQDTIFNLVKNPAGLQGTLDFIARDPDPYNIYLAINKRPADGEDLTWLREVDFSVVAPEKLVIGGEAAQEARDLIQAGGIQTSQASLEDLALSPKKTYLLANYTAMGPLKDELKALE